MTNNLWLRMFDSFYRSGSLVFGGGHVVLPLLENEFVPQGLISPDSFITGYAAAQAVPGPLFTFSSYIGMSIEGIEEEFWLLSLYSYQHFYYYLECYHFGMILNLTLMLKVFKRYKRGCSRYSYRCIL